MPQYKKVFDVGTYAGVSGLTRVGIPTLRTPGAGGKQVAKSLRFRAANSAYLSRTFAAGNRSTWTWSAWVKRGVIGGTQQGLFAAGDGVANASGIVFVGSSDVLTVYDYVSSAFPTQITTTQAFKDPSTWYHIVVAYDTTQATSTDRIKIYINGIQISPSVITGTYPSLNYSGGWINSATYSASIGREDGFGYYFDGYLADVNFIGGSGLTPSSFGEYNSDNIWVPKAYSGSYSGTNSFYLDFSDVALTSGSNAGYGKDTSGNGNYWNTNGLSVTAGTTYDSMYDSPTDYDNSVYGAGNYCTLSPLGNPNSPITTISNGNLTFSHSSSVGNAPKMSVIGTFGMSTGKWYFEYIAGATVNDQMGISTAIVAGAAQGSQYALYTNSGSISVTPGTASGSPATYTTGDIIGVAYDVDAQTVTFYKNGTSQATVSSIGAYTWFPARTPGSSSTGGSGDFNFGQQPFRGMYVSGSGSSFTGTGAPPTGFKALNTKNITRPTDANMWFYGDTPDLMWIKNRTATADHSLTDTIRGVGLGITTNVTPAAENGAQDVAEMNKFGMTLIGASSRTTAASNNFVYWGWKAGGATTVTNTQGSITSQVSANVAAGFSIVSYTGTGATGGTVGHGLGAAPSLILAKARPQALNWIVYTAVTGKDNYLLLDNTAASTATSNVWGSSAPTANVFGVFANASSGNNYPSVAHVAYCFTPIAGYSAFGSYTGNGSTDGPFVYTGFRPRFILLKITSAVGDWYIFDTSRSSSNGANVIDYKLYPNVSNAENGLSGETTSTNNIDILSNGFKLRTTNGNTNSNTNTYIYAAFAEHPFKIARAR